MCVLVQIKNALPVNRGEVEISAVVLITEQMTSAVFLIRLCDLALMPVSLVCSGAH